MLRRSKNKRKAPAAEPESGPVDVLVVGDDADARELLARVLDRAGHEVTQVDGAPSALEALGMAPRRAVVALLHGDGGASLTESIRDHEDETVAAVPLVVLADEESAVNAATRAGADGTLTRPFHADELTGELDEVLGRTPEERAEIRKVADLRQDD
ncbi:MAG: response regulator [Actinomycetota bacterium]